MEWVVVDGERRFGNGFVLPAGGLRELPSRLKKVQAVICNGKNANAGEHAMHLEPDFVINLKTGEKRKLSEFTQPVYALAGIGYPPRFFNMLKGLGIPLADTFSFADHQAFTAEMIMPKLSQNLPLLMTEKDAVKCKAFTQENWWYVPVSAIFSEKSTACLVGMVMDLIKN